MIVRSPAGRIKAYDAAALGVDANLNSLCFAESGDVTGLSTSGDIIVKDRRKGKRGRISQTDRCTLADKAVKNSLKLCFRDGTVSINNGQRTEEYVISDCDFLFMPDFDLSLSNCGRSCDGCTVCG